MREQLAPKAQSGSHPGGLVAAQSDNEPAFRCPGEAATQGPSNLLPRAVCVAGTANEADSHFHQGKAERE